MDIQPEKGSKAAPTKIKNGQEIRRKIESVNGKVLTFINTINDFVWKEM